MKKVKVQIKNICGCPLCGSHKVKHSALLPAVVPLPGSAVLEYLWSGEKAPALNTCALCNLVYKNFHLNTDTELDLYEIWRRFQGPRWSAPGRSGSGQQNLMETLTAEFVAINGRSPESIIDVGAGEGGYLDNVINVERYSLDINEQSALENSQRGVSGIVADLCSDRFDVAQKFDVVTCFDVLEHLRAPDIAMKNIASLLRPGGIFVGETGNILSLLPSLAGKENWWYVNVPEHKVFWHEAVLRTSLLRCGLQVNEFRLRSHKERSVWSPRNLLKLFLFFTKFGGEARRFRKVHMKDHLYFTSTKLL